jgi:excinuclease UvrABC ATPase subunit
MVTMECQVEADNGCVPTGEMQNFRNGFAPRPSDVFIAVMGVTGAGKSTFISLCSGREVKIGHNLQGCNLLQLL